MQFYCSRQLLGMDVHARLQESANDGERLSTSHFHSISDAEQVHNANHTHSLANFQYSRLSDQQTNVNCSLQYQKWSSQQDEFYMQQKKNIRSLPMQNKAFLQSATIPAMCCHLESEANPPPTFPLSASTEPIF